MKRILLALTAVLAAITLGSPVAASQADDAEQVGREGLISRASEASLSLNDVDPEWRELWDVTFFSESIDMSVSDVRLGGPDDPTTYLFNTVMVGDPSSAEWAYAQVWPPFTRNGQAIVDGPPIGMESVWIGPRPDPTQPTRTPRTEAPRLSIDFGVMFKTSDSVVTVLLQGQPGRFSQADVMPLALLVADRLGWVPA